MQKGFIPILIIVGLLALSGMVGGGYYYYQQQKIRNINSFEEMLTTFKQNSQVGEKSSVLQEQPKKFSSESFDFRGTMVKPEGEIKFNEVNIDEATKFIADVDYPELLLDERTQLKKLSCSNKYTRWDLEEKQLHYYLDDGVFLYLSDLSLSSIKQELAEELKRSNYYLDSIQECRTDNKKVVIYSDSSYNNSPNFKNGTHFALVNDTNQIISHVVIPEEEEKYFGCNTPLQFQDPDVFYYQCGSGDACCGTASIYKIDFKKRKYDQIIKCESFLDPTDREGALKARCN